MAEYIKMKQVPGGTVTSKDDRIVYDANLPDSGIIYGCEISYIGNNMIHINAGYGVMKGGLFEIEDHTEYVEYAKSGSITGQIYLHLDLSADDKLTIVKETTNDLHPMIQDAQANYTNGIYEMQLCTFTATTTTLENVKQTFAVVNLGVLDTLEEIQANTLRGQKAGALAVKELNNNLGGLRFGSQDGKYGYIKKEAGTDVFVPFSSLDFGEMLYNRYQGQSNPGGLADTYTCTKNTDLKIICQTYGNGAYPYDNWWNKVSLNNIDLTPVYNKYGISIYQISVKANDVLKFSTFNDGGPCFWFWEIYEN